MVMGSIRKPQLKARMLGATPNVITSASESSSLPKSLVVFVMRAIRPSSDMATFATGGYARGLQTKAIMHKIDTDGDGTVSHDEFIAYQSKVFDMMDKKQSGSLGPQEFLGK